MTDRFSFVCSAGCGVCKVKLIAFEYERTETLDGIYLGGKFEPQVVSSCCGSTVNVYDNQTDDWGPEVCIAKATTSQGEGTSKEGSE